ncbi:MAG TPA: quinolinate synthase NadA [Thermomicrobiales bacterium]|nr:quinolinate synthase NadA [Thermomicrobiales bacterium]
MIHTALPVLTDAQPAAAARALQEEVRRLAREREAVILAHNYQVPEVQDVADFVGDSLGLALEAARTAAPVIVMCGVYFMAETAKIVNPERTVLIPDETAGCSLADSITVEQLRAWKAEHPGAVVVSYVNTTAEIKAESDYCVTSGNAEAVIRAIPQEREILFLPDVFLGTWLKRSLGRENMEVWMGECHVHAGIRTQEILARQAAYPDAELLIHPECGCTSQLVWAYNKGALPAATTRVLSTEGMVRETKASQADTLLIATETGLLHRLRKEVPGKAILAADEGAVCRYMKQITLPKLRDTLRDLRPQVDVDPAIADRARLAIDRMLAVRA